jgi:hypothetical protein
MSRATIIELLASQERLTVPWIQLLLYFSLALSKQLRSSPLLSCGDVQDAKFGQEVRDVCLVKICSYAPHKRNVQGYEGHVRIKHARMIGCTLRPLFH